MGNWGSLSDLLKVDGAKTFALAAAAAIFLFLTQKGVIPKLETWMIIAAWVVLLACSCLTTMAFLSQLANLISQLSRPISRWHRYRKGKKAFEDYLPHLLDRERRIFAHLLHHNQKTFTADMDGGHAGTLLARKFIIMAAPGPLVDRTRFPMLVPDHVWSVLQEHRDEFPFAPGRRDEPDPWHIPWMAR